jgi:UDP-N-acetylmuramate dehydrogenase
VSDAPAPLGAAPADALDAVALALAPLGDRVRRNVALAAHTTYRVGGPAALLVAPAGPGDLAVVAAALGGTRVPVLVVGKGSNLLVADGGFAGVVVVPGAGFDTVTVAGTGVVAGAAAALPVVARQTAAAGLTGFEWAVGVPGTIGGAVRMNAGGHGSDMAANLVGVRLFDLRTGEDGEVPAHELSLGYRSSSVGPDTLVCAARLRLAAADRARCEATIAEIVRWRRTHQPGGANAGSVFTNPPGDSAGRLIEASGAKGLRVGTAAVSAKHANFIQVDPGGSANDVAALMDAVAARVASHTGVTLVAETRLVGFPGTLGGPPAPGAATGSAPGAGASG